MEGEVSMLSQNQIRNIIMDSDRDEEAYYTSTDTTARCRVCSARGVRRKVVFKCVKCDVALCADRNCFEDYHTKTNF